MDIQSLLKIDRPIGKLEFFKAGISIFFLQLVAAILFIILTSDVFGIKSIIWLPVIFLIFIEIPLLYLYFIQCGKRTWDIFGSLGTGIIWDIIFFVFTIAGIFSFGVPTLLVFLTLALSKGKITE